MKTQKIISHGNREPASFEKRARGAIYDRSAHSSGANEKTEGRRFSGAKNREYCIGAIVLLLLLLLLVDYDKLITGYFYLSIEYV